MSEGSPVTLVSFGETTVVMDSCVEKEEEMEEQTQTSQGVGSKFHSEWTEITGVTPKGSQIVGSTFVANGGGPVAGSTTGGGGGGYSSVSGTSANSTTRVDITEFDPIHKS